MKRLVSWTSRLFIVHLILAFTFLSLYPLEADGKRVKVKGYYRKDGTYVKPHYRTSPDRSPYNNYSTPGNYNPNKGTITTGDLQKYLDRYNTNSRSRSASSGHSYGQQSTYTPRSSYATTYVSPHLRSNGTYVKPHLRTAKDGNPFNNYSYPGNYNLNTGKQTTGNPSTYLRNYYTPSASVDWWSTGTTTRSPSSSYVSPYSTPSTDWWSTGTTTPAASSSYVIPYSSPSTFSSPVPSYSTGGAGMSSLWSSPWLD